MTNLRATKVNNSIGLHVGREVRFSAGLLTDPWEQKGWIFLIHADEEGVLVWIECEDGRIEARSPQHLRLVNPPRDTFPCNNAKGSPPLELLSCPVQGRSSDLCPSTAAA